MSRGTVALSVAWWGPTTGAAQSATATTTRKPRAEQIQAKE